MHHLFKLIDITMKCRMHSRNACNQREKTYYQTKGRQ